jgi:hypothetical protein
MTPERRGFPSAGVGDDLTRPLFAWVDAYYQGRSWDLVSRETRTIETGGPRLAPAEAGFLAAIRYESVM